MIFPTISRANYRYRQEAIRPHSDRNGRTRLFFKSLYIYSAGLLAITLSPGTAWAKGIPSHAEMEALGHAANVFANADWTRCSYTGTVTTNDRHTQVERRQVFPDGSVNWTLISVNGAPPTPAEVREFNSHHATVQTKSADDTEYGFAELALPDLSKSTSENVIVNTTGDIEEFLLDGVTVRMGNKNAVVLAKMARNRESDTLQHYSIELQKPFKPNVFTKIYKMSFHAEFDRDPESGAIMQTTRSIDVEGRAIIRRIKHIKEASYTDIDCSVLSNDA